MERRDRPISQKGSEWDVKAGGESNSFHLEKKKKKGDIHSNKMLASILNTSQNVARIASDINIHALHE